jgi:hypothetical protein
MNAAIGRHRGHADARAARSLARDELAAVAIEPMQVAVEVADDDRTAHGGRAQAATLEAFLLPDHRAVAPAQGNATLPSEVAT